MFGRLFGSNKKDDGPPPRVDKVEIVLFLSATMVYKFPPDFENRMDNATFSAITRSINEIHEDIGLDLQKKADFWGRMVMWDMLALVIGFMGGFPCTAIGASRGPQSLLIVGIVCLVLFVGGMCGFFIIPTKQNNYNEQRTKLLTDELNKKLNIMNQRTVDQMVLSYGYDRKLVIELKVDRLNLPNNILYIPNNYDASQDQYNNNNNNIGYNNYNANNNINTLQMAQQQQPLNQPQQQEEIVMIQMPDGRMVAAKVIGNVNNPNPGGVYNNNVNQVQAIQPSAPYVQPQVAMGGEGQHNVMTMQ